MESLDYVARCPGCERIVAAASGELDKREVAKEVGKWIRWGMSVERMHTEAVRNSPWCHADDCEMKPKKRRK